MTTTLTLELADFATLFGCTTDDIPDDCRDLISRGNWRYSPIPQAERDAIILNLLHRLERREMSIVNPEDKSRWLKGWGENRDDFVKSGGSLDALVPRYIRAGMPLRLNGDFVRTEDPNFELRWYEVFRLWLFRKFFAGFDHVFEFGCGSGFNVAMLAEMYPKATVVGLDWAEPSCEIVERLRTDRGLRTVGRQFDFFKPDDTLELPPNSAVLTIGALEQTGDGNQKFLEFLMRKRPALCVHVEPILDWYDPDSLVDHLAIRCHELRNFWRGYPGRLQLLEQAGQLKILKTKRANFGSLVLEGYSQLIWQPV